MILDLSITVTAWQNRDEGLVYYYHVALRWSFSVGIRSKGLNASSRTEPAVYKSSGH